jgi:hypothetical protein
MPAYEHVVNGVVTERVTTVDGSPEDTRIGVAALDRVPGADGWRLAGTVDPEPDTDSGKPTDSPKDPPAEEQKPPVPAAPAPKPKPNPKD